MLAKRAISTIGIPISKSNLRFGRKAHRQNQLNVAIAADFPGAAPLFVDHVVDADAHAMTPVAEAAVFHDAIDALPAAAERNNGAARQRRLHLQPYARLRHIQKFRFNDALSRRDTHMHLQATLQPVSRLAATIPVYSRLQSSGDRQLVYL